MGVLIVELAMAEAEAAATDAPIQLLAHPLQFADPAVERAADRQTDGVPVASGGRATLRQLAEFAIDFTQRHAQPLRDQDKAQPPDIAAQEAALIARCPDRRSEGHTSELQSLMRISYAVFCL